MTLFQDIRHALRSLAKTPAFTGVAILTLMLATGATTAMFSIVEALLWRPLPFAGSDELVTLQGTIAGRGTDGLAPADYLDLLDAQQTLGSVAASREDVFNLSGDGRDAEQLTGLQVTTPYFDVFGLRPLVGRTFSLDDRGTKRVVISHGLWQRRFGGDPAVAGRSLRLNGESFEVVGVMPPSFAWGENRKVDLWALAEGRVPSSPIPLPAGLELERLRGLHYFGAVARLKPAVTIEQATGDIDVVAKRLAEAYPSINANRGFVLHRLRESQVGDVRLGLMVLLGAVGCVLLIAAANVAGLLLARGAGRRREVALRTALGASRARVVALLLTESVVLALLGAAGGLLLAAVGIDVVLSVVPDAITHVTQIDIDRTVVLFAVVVALVTGVVFGLVPALEGSRVNLLDALKDGGTHAGGRRRARLRAGLVVCETALAMTLLVGAGLLLNSFVRLMSVPPGFTARHVSLVQIPLPESQYQGSAAHVAFYGRLLDRLRTEGPTRDAALAFSLPLATDTASTSVTIEGQPALPPGQRQTAQVTSASRGYLTALGIPLKAGRDLADSDTGKGQQVALVNETFVTRYFAGVDPIGRRFEGLGAKEDGGLLTVVGVVGDVRQSALSEDPPPTIYVPYPQFLLPFMYVVVNTGTAEPSSVVPTIRAVVKELDPDLPLGEIRSMRQLVEQSTAQPRFQAVLLAAFALVALVLASVGLYAIVSYSVTQRAPELGLRVALGATSADVVRMVLREGAWLAGAGLVLGLGASLALTRLLGSFLYGIGATDVPTFAGTSIVLAAVTALASYVPARRASRVDPTVALK